MTTTIILVRHGQTEWNRVERFRGRFDIPLNQTGKEQAKKTAERIAAHWNPSRVLTSPLGRALETASIIAKTCHLTAQTHEGMIDIDYGKWQGLTIEEAKITWPDEVVNWFEHPESAEIPDGERLMDVRKRVSRFLNEISEKYSDKEIVLVSHTVVNRLLLMNAMDIDNSFFWSLRQDPCAINILERKGDILELVSLNDTSHLEK